MGLIRLTIQHVRIIEHAELVPSDSLNLIFGQNASGKTSLLEAIDFLSRARTFRSSQLDTLLTRGRASVLVAGKVRQDSAGVIPIGIEKSRQETRARVYGRAVRAVAELAKVLPVLVLHPESHELVTGGPGVRRAFLDWGGFHGVEGFLEAWQRYQRILQQRNAALRQRSHPRLISAWDEELVEAAERIDAGRREQLESLKRPVKDVVEELLEGQRLELDYRAGWPGGSSYAEALASGLEKDRELGYTQVGPHRGELRVSLEGAPVGKLASRGQQKIVVAALTLAQGRLLRERAGKTPVLLVDDLPSELDSVFRQRLVGALAGTRAQVFITAIEPEALDLSAWREHKMFHVKHGQVKELI